MEQLPVGPATNREAASAQATARRFNMPPTQAPGTGPRERPPLCRTWKVGIALMPHAAATCSTSSTSTCAKVTREGEYVRGRGAG